MYQKGFRPLFVSTLTVALFVGVFALTSSPASAIFETTCPIQICPGTGFWEYDSWCNYYEESTGCLFRCWVMKKQNSWGTSYCRDNCMAL